MSTLKKIEIIQGDDTTIQATFTDGDGAIVDISGSIMKFTVKKDFGSPAVISKIVASGLHTNPTGGISSVLLTHDDTDIDLGDYYWDIELTFSTGIINSVDYGKFVVKPDIS